MVVDKNEAIREDCAVVDLARVTANHHPASSTTLLQSGMHFLLVKGSLADMILSDVNHGRLVCALYYRGPRVNSIRYDASRLLAVYLSVCLYSRLLHLSDLEDDPLTPALVASEDYREPESVSKAADRIRVFSLGTSNVKREIERKFSKL